jgi:membrane protein implicated in regulation of membrane protease activity
MSKRGPVLTIKTKLQNQLIWMICAAMGVPTLILGGALYLVATQLSNPATGAAPHEVVASVVRYVAILFPLASAALLYWVFKGTNTLVGPIERIIRELDQQLAGQRTGPIVLRPGDQLIPLADKINVLLEERQSLKKP